MIEETGLPMWLPHTCISQRSGQRLFYETNGFAQGIAVWIDSEKQMNVIGHDDIFTTNDAFFAFSFHVSYEMVMELIGSQHRPSIEGAKRDEIERWVELFEYIRQARWSAWVS
jgi:hypothetical protein